MTLITSWIGVDDKKHGKSIASIYFAADSRYSWGNQAVFNGGQKVFGCNKYPEIFCFCGDVLFPLLTISVLIDRIDNDILINLKDDAEAKNTKVFEFIKQSIKKYPKNVLTQNSTILYATRIEHDFYLYKYSLDNNGVLLSENIPLPKESKVVYVGGSGKSEFEDKWTFAYHEKTNNYGTSRAVYKCFAEVLHTTKMQTVGGAPQIVGLYRGKGFANFFGIIDNWKRYFLGAEHTTDMQVENIEWRNKNFERVDGKTMKLIDGAQAQP